MQSVSRRITKASITIFAMSMIGGITLLSPGVFKLFSGKEREASEEFIKLYRQVGASEQIAILLARREMRTAVFRMHTDDRIPLREAQDNIRQILRNAHSPENMATAGIPTSVITALNLGDKIAAVKAYRDERHVSLREAKETIEYLQEY